MNKVGILAYGSLIDCPGEEIQGVIAKRVKGVETPFKVEFARRSDGRDGAPTLVPIETDGAYVKGVILVLKEHISEEVATDMLWRRETCKVGSQQTYSPPVKPGPNTVVIKRLDNFHGIGVVLYAKIGQNIDHLTAKRLAALAIGSARAEAGAHGRDGITYLMDAKRNGIMTPLMPGYEKEMLLQTGTQSLKEALEVSRADSAQ